MSKVIHRINFNWTASVRKVRLVISNASAVWTIQWLNGTRTVHRTNETQGYFPHRNHKTSSTQSDEQHFSIIWKKYNNTNNEFSFGGNDWVSRWWNTTHRAGLPRPISSIRSHIGFDAYGKQRDDRQLKKIRGDRHGPLGGSSRSGGTDGTRWTRNNIDGSALNSSETPAVTDLENKTRVEQGETPGCFGDHTIQITKKRESNEPKDLRSSQAKGGKFNRGHFTVHPEHSIQHKWE